MKNSLKKRTALASFVAVLALSLFFAWCHRDEPQVPAPSPADKVTKRERPKEQESRRAPGVEVLSASRKEDAWTDPESGGKFKVRKALRMTAEPTVAEQATTATATVAIRVAETAEFWNPQTMLWEAMPDEQFGRWAKDVGDPQDVHATTASITRELKEDGRPVTVSRSAFGESDQQPHPDWNETASGIHIALNWTGDRLKISWASTACAKQEQEVAIPFSKTYQSPPEAVE